MQGNRGLQLIEIALRLGEQVQFGSHMPQHRGARAHRHRQLAPGLVTFGRADMRAQYVERQEERRAALDVLAVKRVIAVGRPDAVGMGENAHVGTRTAR